jgi:hypothetical protein
MQQARTALGVADFQRVLEYQDFDLVGQRGNPAADAGRRGTQACGTKRAPR